MFSTVMAVAVVVAATINVVATAVAVVLAAAVAVVAAAGALTVAIALVGAVAIVMIAGRMRAIFRRRGGRAGGRFDPSQQLDALRRQVTADGGLRLSMARQSEQSRNAGHGEQLHADRARRAEGKSYHFLKSFEVNGEWTMTTQRTAPAS
jgi:hypothetical protein